MNHHPSNHRRTVAVSFFHVLAGVLVFLVLQYLLALWQLSHAPGNTGNQFSQLAKEKYLGYLILQNLQVLIGYALVGLAATWILQPFVSWWTARSKYQSVLAVILRSLALVLLVHGFFIMRLGVTRPYFLQDFGNWYFKALDLIPTYVKPTSLWIIFTFIPLGVLGCAAWWQFRRYRRRGWLITALIGGGVASLSFLGRTNETVTKAPSIKSQAKPINVIIIGSDSLRADRLGCAGYTPARTDGLASKGVSPVIDSLAARSIRFENCYTSIASTMESGIQLMASMYPQSHGVRQMYPDRETAAATKKRIATLPMLLRGQGYDTAAIGDWCAGYYEVFPLGMEHLSVSTFDNFKIYMSQAVMMAHFIVPLYFDNALGYRIFPQIESFASFVTPDVVTKRVEDRLAAVAKERKPFFWHVFYSYNHLPYLCQEPYRSMFSDPNYVGPNRNKVEFDIDSFIGGTDLESKWKALPPPEIAQIRALYDGCTRQFDDGVGKILAALKSNGLEDNTIVIITADHGDDLYESGVTLGHGLTFNGGLQANHPPMIVHIPGMKSRVIHEAVRLIDVAPTMADFLGVEKPQIWQGQSFAGWIRGDETPIHRPIYGETGFPFIQFRVKGVERPKLPTMTELTWIDPDFNYQFVLKKEYLAPLIQAKQRCLKTRDWKLVCTPTAEEKRHFALFHMRVDPTGETDVAASRPDVLAAMQTALERWMDEQIETSIAGIFPTGEPE